MIYDNLNKIKNTFTPVCNYNYVNGCFIELKDWPDDTYRIQFIDKDTGKMLHQDNIGTNNWSKCFFQYYVNYQIVISQGGEIVKILDQNLENQKVVINIESKSIGDNIAWMPYAEEFRKKHNCKVLLSTFHNDLFKDQYPEIIFIAPGTYVEDMVAQYKIGWFYNDDGTINTHRNVRDPRMFPMQKTATDILGLEYKEIKPKITVPDVEKRNIVALGIHSTAQAKYWNNPTGWQEVTDYIKSVGSLPVIVSKEEDGFMGIKHPLGAASVMTNSTIEQAAGVIKSAKAFVGVSSGLSWLAWACDVPVILISGFSDKYTEFECYRIGQENKEVCSGCFNRFKLESGSWNWCPLRQGTDKQFECSKTIKAEQIINILKQLI